MKKILNSRVGIAIIAFAIGGAVALFIAPEVIKKVVEKEIVEVEKIVEVEVEKIVEKEVIKEVIKTEKVRVVKRKETFPDGRIIETEIYESESEQISRLEEQFKEKYAELLIQKEREFEEKFKEVKIHKNPKRLNVFAGAGISFSNPTDTHFLGGFTYPVWGPFTAGAQATTDGTAAVMVGFRF